MDLFPEALQKPCSCWNEVNAAVAMKAERRSRRTFLRSGIKLHFGQDWECGACPGFCINCQVCSSTFVEALIQ